jgi:beta-lactamase class A
MTAIAILQEQLEQLVTASGFAAGVAALHIERGERAAVRGDRRFPSCSVFKVPVLVELFRQAAHGALSLDDRWRLTQEEKTFGSGVLQLLDPELQPSVRDLATLMITISDNTATDMIVRRLGPERITATVEKLGLRNTWVSVTCRDLLESAFGRVDVALPPAERARLMRDNSARPDSPAYHTGPDNDVTSANDMVALFARVQRGIAHGIPEISFDAEACRTMLEILYRQQLNERLPRYLPPTLPFAHKTGSLGGAFEIHNDAGVLTLPDGGHLCLAAFVQTAVPDGCGGRELAALRRRMDDLISDAALAAYSFYAG